MKNFLLGASLVVAGVPTIVFGSSFASYLIDGKTPEEAVQVLANNLGELFGRVDTLEVATATIASTTQEVSKKHDAAESALEEQVILLKTQNDEVKAQNDAVKAQNDAIEAKNLELQQESDKHSQEVANLKTENESISSMVTTIQAEAKKPDPVKKYSFESTEYPLGNKGEFLTQGQTDIKIFAVNISPEGNSDIIVNQIVFHSEGSASLDSIENVRMYVGTPGSPRKAPYYPKSKSSDEMVFSPEATIPLSSPAVGKWSTIYLVADLPGDLTPYDGKKLRISVSSIESDSEKMSSLPVYGEEFTEVATTTRSSL